MLTQIRNVAENSKSNSLGGIFVMFCFSFFWNKTIRIFCLLLAHDCCELLLFLSFSNCFIKYFIDSSNHFLVSLCWNTTHGSYTFSEILQISISEHAWVTASLHQGISFPAPKLLSAFGPEPFSPHFVKYFRPATLLKKDLIQHTFFPVKFAKFTYFEEHLWTTASIIFFSYWSLARNYVKKPREIKKGFHYVNFPGSYLRF